MRRVQLTLMLLLCAGQATAATVPFTYCLEDGKFCCVGWAAEFCGDHAPGPGPELTATSSCSNVQVGLSGTLVGLRSHLPHPGPSPAIGKASPSLRPPTRDVAPRPGETWFRRPSDTSTHLESVILLL